MIIPILAVLGWVCGTLALAVALVISYTSRLRIQQELSNMRVDVAGMESRLEHYLRKQLDQTAIDIRQAAQSDAIDLIQASMQDGRAPQDPLSMASFRRFGE